MYIQHVTPIICFLLFVGVSGALAQEAARSTSQGVFTEEQAKRGAVAYNANCASCHGANLRSTDREVPNLTDGSFKSGWIGKTIAEKFEAARDNMPPRDERSLPDQVYLDIVTFVLRANKAPVGTEELKPDFEILKQIKISDPAG
jgi:mono/diheme cytochrome c family protein